MTTPDSKGKKKMLSQAACALKKIASTSKEPPSIEANPKRLTAEGWKRKQQALRKP